MVKSVFTCIAVEETNPDSRNLHYTVRKKHREISQGAKNVSPGFFNGI